MDKYYTINETWVAEDRRKLLAFARDMLNSDYAGHRLTFQLFAQSPPFAHLAAVYRNFNWDEPLGFTQSAADLSDRVFERPDSLQLVSILFSERGNFLGAAAISSSRVVTRPHARNERSLAHVAGLLLWRTSAVVGRP